MVYQPTQKERTLLEDQKKHEEVCIEKYRSYAAQVRDPELKQLLNTYAGQEQQHLNTINQMLAGQRPAVPMGQAPRQAPQSGPTAGEIARGTASANDAVLLTDLLMTEKYVSGTYDTAIFECTNAEMRQVLNHIQKEEQQHGEGIFNYMQAHGMYKPQ